VGSDRMHGIYTSARVSAGAGQPIGGQVVGGSEWVGRGSGEV
jgi:hypothetical protein